MDSHLKYIIAGAICCSEGGLLLFLGLEYGWLGKLLGELLDLHLFSPESIWTFIIIGTISLIVGGILLFIGVVKYRQQNKVIYAKF